jgi:hypothetical protein
MIRDIRFKLHNNAFDYVINIDETPVFHGQSSDYTLAP